MIKKILLFGMLFTFNAYSQTEPEKEYPTVANESDDIIREFPFVQVFTDGDISISAVLEGQPINDLFKPVFQKYKLKGIGYTWEKAIIQLLKKEDKNLLKQLHFRSEEGGFYVDVDSEDAATKFLDIICPYFKDAETLDKTLKGMDKSKL